MALSPLVTRATLVTRPDDPIRVVWVELHHLRTKRVRRLRRSERVPRATCVCSVEELAGRGDEVSAIRREDMVVESEESLLWKKAIPCVAFVARLPDRRVEEPDKNSRRIFEVRLLHDWCWEFELSSLVSTRRVRDDSAEHLQSDE